MKNRRGKNRTTIEKHWKLLFLLFLRNFYTLWGGGGSPGLLNWNFDDFRQDFPVRMQENLTAASIYLKVCCDNGSTQCQKDTLIFSQLKFNFTYLIKIPYETHIITTCGTQCSFANSTIKTRISRANSKFEMLIIFTSFQATLQSIFSLWMLKIQQN